MPPILILFFVVFGLNVIPAFAPPTWMVFSYIGFRHGDANVFSLAVVGAAAATLGRVTLAKLARSLIRQRFMGERSRQNLDSIREHLEPRRKLTFGVFLFYAFMPLPSNDLFIAYGLTTMSLPNVAVPFFIGRTVSYSFWGFTASAVASRFTFDSDSMLSYFSLYFVISQILLVGLIFVFAKIDWRVFFASRRLRWLKKAPGQPTAP